MCNIFVSLIIFHNVSINNLNKNHKHIVILHKRNKSDTNLDLHKILIFKITVARNLMIRLWFRFIQIYIISICLFLTAKYRQKIF